MMDPLKHLITGLCISCLAGVMPAQNVHQIDHACSGMKLVELLGELEKSSGFRFFYRQEWIDTLTVSGIEEASPVDQVLSSVLEGTGLNLYREENDFYIYPGEPIVTELPPFEVAFRSGGGRAGGSVSANQESLGRELYHHWQHRGFEKR